MKGDHLKEIVVVNRETGQTMTTTVKKFESIYRDKGFELVDRENADSATAPAASAKAKQNFARPSRGTGSSAADVAKEIGLGSNQPPDSGDAMTFDQAAKDTAERNKDTAK